MPITTADVLSEGNVVQEALTERDNDLDERVAEVEELKKQLASLEKALEDEKAKASSADKQPKVCSHLPST